MSHLIFDFSNTHITNTDLQPYEQNVKRLHHQLHDQTGAGSDFLGWITLPSQYDQNEFERIKSAAAKIQQDSEVVLIAGIGGSYLGAKAAIDMLQHHFYNLIDSHKRKAPQILFIGNNLCANYLNDVLDLVQHKSFSIVVISKSGTTTETSIAFRLFRKTLFEQVGLADGCKRIYAITDQTKGALKTEAEQFGYQSFVIPDNIGGRYSVLTAVGLLPMAIANIDIAAVMQGAQTAQHELDHDNLHENAAYQYAMVRNILYQSGKTNELLVNYEPSLQYLGEWWKQLFGESEGKDHKGIFPATANFTTDLHSLGQYIQEGRRNIFETVLKVQYGHETILIEEENNNLDGLNYLAGKSISEINDKAFQGTLLAHKAGDVPNLIITLPKRDPFTFGYIVYYFEKACAMSGYLLGVNPFDQPGVEAYKRNMFALLGKEGYGGLSLH